MADTGVGAPGGRASAVDGIPSGGANAGCGAPVGTAIEDGGAIFQGGRVESCGGGTAVCVDVGAEGRGLKFRELH